MSRSEWIIGLLAGLLISGIVIIFLVVVTGGDTAEETAMQEIVAAPTSVFTGSTSMQAYELAKDEALRWQSDAVLLKADTTWPRGTSREKLLSGTTTWILGFYSPSSSSTANISVLDDQAKLVNQYDLGQPLSPKEVDQWRIDSGVAMYRLLDEGGEDFLSENGTSTLTMSLSTDNESERLEWFLLLFGTQAGNSLAMRLDASTGEVLETVVSN
jgi:hypothetical protein